MEQKKLPLDDSLETCKFLCKRLKPTFFTLLYQVDLIFRTWLS